MKLRARFRRRRTGIHIPDEAVRLVDWADPLLSDRVSEHDAGDPQSSLPAYPEEPRQIPVSTSAKPGTR